MKAVCNPNDTDHKLDTCTQCMMFLIKKAFSWQHNGLLLLHVSNLTGNSFSVKIMYRSVLVMLLILYY